MILQSCLAVRLPNNSLQNRLRWIEWIKWVISMDINGMTFLAHKDNVVRIVTGCGDIDRCTDGLWRADDQRCDVGNGALSG